MNRFQIMFMSLILIIIGVFNHKNIFEKFNLASDVEFTDYHASYRSALDESPNVLYSQVDYQPQSEMKCCLIQNKYLSDRNHFSGGSFRYTFKKLENEMCKLNNHRLDNNSQLFIDGYDGWSNDRCNEEVSKIGSCRNVNRECIDFVDKEYCDKYRMTWSDKTCRDPMDYQWIDRTNFTKPIPEDDGTYLMFNKESQIGKDLDAKGTSLFSMV